MKKKKIKKLIDKEIQKFAQTMPMLKSERDRYFSADSNGVSRTKQSAFNPRQDSHPFFDGRAGA